MTASKDPELLAAAERLGMTPTGVRHRIAVWGDRELALTRPKRPGETQRGRPAWKNRRVVPWDTAPWGRATDLEIAKLLSVHPKSVLNYRRRHGIAASQQQRPWTEVEDNELAELYWKWWTPARRAKLARELGRTPEALRQRAVDLRLSERARPEDRWPRSLEQLERETGYEACRIRNAAAHLGIALARRGPGKQRPHYAITERQAERIFAFLATVPDGVPLRPRRREENAA